MKVKRGPKRVPIIKIGNEHTLVDNNLTRRDKPLKGIRGIHQDLYKGNFNFISLLSFLNFIIHVTQYKYFDFIFIK